MIQSAARAQVALPLDTVVLLALFYQVHSLARGHSLASGSSPASGLRMAEQQGSRGASAQS